MGDLSTQLGTTETLQTKIDVLQQRYEDITLHIDYIDISSITQFPLK